MTVESKALDAMYRAAARRRLREGKLAWSAAGKAWVAPEGVVFQQSEPEDPAAAGGAEMVLHLLPWAVMTGEIRLKVNRPEGQGEVAFTVEGGFGVDSAVEVIISVPVTALSEVSSLIARGRMKAACGGTPPA